MKNIVVIGGGLTGLSAAFHLKEDAAPGMAPRVELLEAAPRLGGKVWTLEEDGYRVEWAANGWLGSARFATELALRAGLEGEIVVAGSKAAKRFIYHDRRLHAIVPDPVGFFASPMLSLGGKLRILGEPFIPQKKDGVDESVEAFAARRIGPEAARVLVSAAVTGIFAGDSRELSLPSAFPRMAEMEAEYGSLVKALISLRLKHGKEVTAAGPRGSQLSFRRGMYTWARGLAEKVGDAARPGTPVAGLEPYAGGWRVALEGGTGLDADAVVLATDTAATVRLLRPLEPAAADTLATVSSSSVAVVALAFRGEAFGHDADGFGFLVPRGEDLRILGALWESNVFEGRAPEGDSLLRVMIGGTRSPGLLDLGDDELLRIALEDLDRACGLKAQPVRHWVVRHRPAIPQYTVGHAERIRGVDAAVARRPGLFLAGNSYRGIAVGSCMEDGRRGAAQALKHLGLAMPA
ncbi:MAG: protoporphyrinogen oxidase [Candidatus Eisenbacteria bacterium]|nr:protoporphyrinogen oxidase [Candidatus Eisenbacteria bacterium]